MSPINWDSVSLSLVVECPSKYYRETAAELLTRVELIGPLSRTPEDEFRRVYKSLHWNEPDRIVDTIAVVEPRTKGKSPKVSVQLDAWGYVIGALDEWITQARIFYLVSGILESSLRSRLNARMTDVLGPSWPSMPEVPSNLRELASRALRDSQLQAIHALLETEEQSGMRTREELLTEIRQAITPPPAALTVSGQAFLRNMTFAGLKMFFEKKQLWDGKVELKTLFSAAAGAAPNRDKVSSVLTRLNDARNEVAHYRPAKFATFDSVLLDAATLASWFGEDLQHIYSSIDTRETTELSVLLRSLTVDAGWDSRPDVSKCVGAACSSLPPLEWILSRAPLSREDLSSTDPRRACLYHRVGLRRHLGPAGPGGTSPQPG